MDPLDKPFLAGKGAPLSFPLARYLPLIPSDTINQWTAVGPAKGSWLLDPFGAHPLLALEAAKAGYRVLVASNNPILSFILEVLASAPKAQDFESVIAALGASRRGEERLELYIKSLYQTSCTACGQSLQAQAYVWQRDQSAPTGKIYQCQACGDEGEREITQSDLERLKLAGSDGLTRSRAMARVASEKGSDQAEVVEEALKTYLSRPLYILTTLINKAEGLAALPAERKKLLIALLISVCDEANTLWQHPVARPRPRQLTIPAEFHEKNLWMALENAVGTWICQKEPIPLTQWPELPPEEGGICLYQGRIRSLLPLPDEIRPAAILTVIPRANQAFWTLCALWCGWIWGREAVQPLRGALERRRYDWYWMTHALHSALSAVNQQLPEKTPLFTIATEMSPGFFLSLFCAPLSAGFNLQGIAYQPEADMAQFWWESTREVKKPTSSSPKTVIQQALVRYLKELGEPAGSLLLFATALRELAIGSILPARIQAINNDFLGRTQATLAEVLEDQTVFHRLSGRAQSEESGLWILTEIPDDIVPLSDQVEIEIVRLLVDKKEITREAIDKLVYDRFPGLLAPSARLVQTCLESYAQIDSDHPGMWVLRDEDSPVERRAELAAIHQQLSLLAGRLGFTAEGQDPLIWKKQNGEAAYLFYVSASCIFSRFVFQPQPVKAEHHVIVFPGGRTALLGIKQERDPRLKATLDKGWHLLKFRQLREIVERPQLDMALWEELLEGDPPSYETLTQMSMF
jgi:hypothetical protein